MSYLIPTAAELQEYARYVEGDSDFAINALCEQLRKAYKNHNKERKVVLRIYAETPLEEDRIRSLFESRGYAVDITDWAYFVTITLRW